MVAAGEAATASLVPDEPEATIPTEVRPPADPPRVEQVPALAPAPAPAAMAASDVVAVLTADQHAFLARAPRITMAVNDPGGAPQVTSTIYHWDGATFRMPGRQFTLRASNIERDPRVSLFVDDAGGDASVAVTGVASIVHGDAVEPGMLLILAREDATGDPRARLATLQADGDLMLIEVRPTRFVWRTS